MSTQTDVVIVGAGSAGLSAAKELARQGISFVVVEASHRIGGRAYSEEIAPDVWFDLGCAYMELGPDADTLVDETNPFIDFGIEQGLVVEGPRLCPEAAGGPGHRRSVGQSAARRKPRARGTGPVAGR